MGKGDGSCGQRAPMQLGAGGGAAVADRPDVTSWRSVPATLEQAAWACAARGREQFRRQIARIFPDASAEKLEEAIRVTDDRDDEQIVIEGARFWSGRLDGQLNTSAALRRQVDQAMRENARNPLMRQVDERHGRDLVLIFDQPPADDDGITEIMDGSVAARRSSYHTAIYRATLLHLRGKGDGLVPRQWMRVTSSLGLATVLRHERAHELWTNLDVEHRQQFAQEIDRHSLHGLVDGLTLYAAKARDHSIAENARRGFDRRQPLVLESAATESFCELFAMRTHPAWDASQFPGWVGELADRQLSWLGVDA